MTKQVFDVEAYWKVIVYWNVDYDFFNVIADDLKKADAMEEEIWNIYQVMSSGKSKAFTYSNIQKRVSIICFNKHDDCLDCINSIVHEAEHVKQAMLKAYYIEDKGEPPAYTVGYLVMRMCKMFTDKNVVFVCNFKEHC